MSDLNLNELPGPDAVRDAIHIAVIPLIAGEDIYEGKVKLQVGSKDVALRVRADEPAIGIVNPWHPAKPGEYYSVVRKGERFYCLLNPGSVTGMRHHFKHPIFDEAPPIQDESELWLRRFAQHWNFDFDTLIENGIKVQNATDPYDYWVTADGVDLHSASELGEDYDLFWEHLENYTGEKVDEEKRKFLGWSCSC